MDLPKLLSMLLRRELHLTRLDKMEDKYEGTLPLHSRQTWRSEMTEILESPLAGALFAEFLGVFQRMKESQTSPLDSPLTLITDFMLPLTRMARALAIYKYEKQSGRRIDSPPTPGESSAEIEARKAAASLMLSPAEAVATAIAYAVEHKRAPTHDELIEAGKPPNPIPTSEVIARIDSFIDMLVQHMRQSRQELYISCWHLDDLESEAMWRIYCGRNNGIAVVLPYKRLRESLIWPNTHIGEISYINYNLEDIPELGLPSGYPLAMHKRKEFSHEREARIVAWRGLSEDRERYRLPPLGHEIPTRFTPQSPPGSLPGYCW